MSQFLKRIYTKAASIADNTAIYSLWMGSDLSSLEVLSIKSYLYHGHNVVLYIYDDIKNIPDGVDVRDANDILGINSLDHYSLYRNSKGYTDKESDVEIKTYSLYSDLFRYKLLSTYGGWWSDLDVICLKPYSFDAPYVFCRAGGGRAWVCGSVLKSPKGSDFMHRCFEETINLCKHIDYVDQTGPALLNAMVPIYKFQIFIVPHKTFFPIWWKDTDEFLKDISLPEESYGVHVCNTIFSFNHDKNGIFGHKCLYERLKKKYL